MDVTSRRGKLVVKENGRVVLSAGEISNGRASVQVPNGFGPALAGLDGHIVLVDSDGMCSAPSAAAAKKMLREAGLPKEHIAAAFGHLGRKKKA